MFPIHKLKTCQIVTSSIVQMDKMGQAMARWVWVYDMCEKKWVRNEVLNSLNKESSLSEKNCYEYYLYKAL